MALKQKKRALVFANGHFFPENVDVLCFATLKAKLYATIKKVDTLK